MHLVIKLSFLLIASPFPYEIQMGSSENTFFANHLNAHPISLFKQTILCEAMLKFNALQLIGLTFPFIADSESHGPISSPVYQL